MLLFDSLHMASNAMSASQLGMQVVGQNLTNANTAGYVREQLVLETGTSRQMGNGVVTGTGVSVNGVRQVIDNFLEERLRSSTSDAMSSATQEKYYTELEVLLNETTDSDLSSSLSAFFNSIDNVLNQPEDVNYREMTVTQGQKLAEDINRIALTIVNMQRDVNTSIGMAADEINSLIAKIEELNTSITLVETKQGTEALGLRDQRLDALSKLSNLINIKTVEDAQSGKVSVYCGSDVLLADGIRNEVYVDGQKENSDDVVMAKLCIRDSMTPLDVRSGTVYGLYQAHETILGGYAQKLDDFANDLIREFNKVYTQGQGLTGFSELSSPAKLDHPEQPINTADLDYPITSGVLTVQVYNKQNNTTIDYDIEIFVEDLPVSDPFSLKQTPEATGTSLIDLAAAIDAVDGLSATVNSHGQLEISSDNTNYEFAFARDTGGVLSALGMNTFFTGSSAASIGVNETVVNDALKFAASRGGVGADTENGVLLAAMGIEKNADLGGKSLIGYYEGIVSETMLAASTVKAVAASDSLYQQSLQTQRDSISGVNVDEETILMMTYQRMFQANSRLVTIIDEMLSTLINM